ncbi:MAG: cadherin repeat domain-containing protein [Proteobacteria bacterium]|nr:cadherin repeat domain-containing protein [Pseudomonadota bacterium]
MEVLLKIIGVDGTPRTVVVKPGDTVKVQPGETVIVSPDQKAAVGVMQQGQDLVLRIDGGEVAVQGFFPSPAQAASEPAPSALVYQDEQGLHVSDGRGAEAVSSSFEVLPLAGVHLPEGFSLSEQFMLPGYEQRLEALRAVFPEVDGFDATLAGGPPELEPIAPAALQVGLPEPLAPYKLTLDEAQEGGGSTLTGDDPLLTAVVASRSADPVLEPNQSPDFTPRSPLEIAEDAAEGTTLDIGAATDADGDALQYSLIGGNVDGAFAINADTGEITVADASALDFETRPSYTLTVAVDDGHGHVVERDIEVSLLDVNDAPLIANQALAVTENSANGTVVGTVQASDVDAGQTLTYSITGGSGASAFQIDAATGELSVADAAQLDREAVASLTVEVSVTDSVVTRTATVTVAVNGINDFAPQITSNANFNVVENGTTVGAVVATDADAGGPPLVYSLVGGADQGLFAINASTGVLRFVAAPDFESPADSGADNVYNVDVQVSDGTNAALQSVTVTVADGNDAPLITSSASATAVENQTVVTTVTASDIDGDVPTFAIVGGADAARFTVDANSGALSFVAAPNFEAPTDSNGDNVYVVQVRANDGNGGLATQTLSVTVTGENDNTPVITSVAAVNFAENGTGTVVDVNATDADLPAQALTFSITGGADAAQFAINAATGVVTFIAAPDFETPTDAGGNNVYDLQVTASDGTLSVAQNIAVTVTGVNDANPVFVSAGTANFAENAVGTILTVQASDADLPAQTLSYSISGGADAARFAINATSGALSFVSSPNAEAPTDAGANNVYDVQVTASDGTRTTNQSIAVTVTGVNDNAPVITSANNVVFTENGLGTVLDVSATDADVPADTLTFSISGGVDAAFFAIDSATGVLTFVTPPDFEAPADSGANNVYNVQVTASDGTSTVNQAIAVTVADVGPTVVISPAAANFAEAGTGTVLDVDAASEEAITYSISGGADAALFAIDAATGVLTFVAPPDFEAPADAGANNVYDVQVTASTLSAGTVAQNIAITVTAANDNDPVITTATTASFAENATGTVIDVNATDADLPAQTLTFSITGGADSARFAINATTGVVTFVSSPNFELPTDVGADNVYDLTVTASDGTRTVNQAIAVTVTAVNEFSPVFTSAASANFSENGTGTIVTVQATDADLPTATLTYSISGGVDSAKFAIDSATGALTFVSAPNFEAPTDSGANNVYNVQVTASDGTNSTNQALAITVTAVNDNDPVITTAAAVNFAENATGTVIDVNATDADLPAQTLTFSITGGADAAKFAINATTGVVTFIASPNFESPTDVGADNVYDLTVTASDGTRTVNQAIAVTVTAVNEFSPVFTSAATANFAENGAGTIVTVQATDADLPTPTLTYSITGGVDAAKFAINATTGALTFVSSPNFEAPTDSGEQRLRRTGDGERRHAVDQPGGRGDGDGCQRRDAGDHDGGGGELRGERERHGHRRQRDGCGLAGADLDVLHHGRRRCGAVRHQRDDRRGDVRQLTGLRVADRRGREQRLRSAGDGE